MELTSAKGTGPHKKYIIRTTAFMGGYTAVNVAAIFGAFDDIGRTAGLALGLVVAAPVAGQIWATLALMAESDEFMRALLAKRFIVASGLAMAIATAWGFMESYGDAPHIPAWIIYPLFWGLFGLVTPFIRTSR